MTVRQFGEIDGEPVDEVALASADGLLAKVVTWGATLRDLLVPLAGGGAQRVVLGLDTLADYQAHSPHFGAIAGRFGNRIANGRFRLGDRTYQLPLNQDGRHSLHGGGNGFGRRPWQLAARDRSSATLTLVSPDGDAGYPGNVTVTCLHRLTAPLTLRIELTATSDAATPINLCHHSYFNLDGSASILDHHLQLDADFYTPTDSDLIPTGEIRTVAGTPYDLREARPLRRADPAGGGAVRYDINLLLRRERLAPSGIAGHALAHAGTLASTVSGIALEVWTTEPALQIYDGGGLDIPVPGLDGRRYGATAGFCLEPQHCPDSPNQPHFPDTILRPGAVYRQVTEYRFVVAG